MEGSVSTSSAGNGFAGGDAKGEEQAADGGVCQRRQR